MIKTYLALWFFVSATRCIQGEEWMKCKPKPGCSIARCDPKPSWWPQDDGELDGYPILCQKSDVSSTDSSGDSSRFDEIIKELGKLEGRLERAENEGDELKLVTKNLEQENAELKSQIDKGRDKSIKIKKIEDTTKELSNQIKQLQNENLEIRSQMSKDKRENKDKIDTVLESLEELKNEYQEWKKSVNSEIERARSNLDNEPKSSCVITFKGICYWTHVESGNNVNFREAEVICSKKGSVPAYFPTEEVYNSVAEDLLRKIPSGRTRVDVFTGVTIDANTRKVNNPREDMYLRWSSGRPLTDGSYERFTHVVLLVTSNSDKSIYAVVWDTFPTKKLLGVVCQRAT